MKSDNPKRVHIELEAALARQVDYLTDLLSLLQDERQFIIQFKPQELTKMTQQKEKLVEQIRLEMEKQKILLQSMGIQLPTDKANGQLIRWSLDSIDMDEQIKARIDTIRGKLEAIASAVMELHGLNRKLIEYSIESVNGLSQMIRRKFFQAGCYSRNASVENNFSKATTLRVVA